MPTGPPLVHLRTVIRAPTDFFWLAGHHCIYTSLREHRDQFPTELVQEIRDLVVYLVELFILRLDELLPAIRTALFAIYFRVQHSVQVADGFA